MATVVREAIDRGVVASSGRREAAGRRLLDADDMDVPDVPELKAELEALRVRRA